MGLMGFTRLLFLNLKREKLIAKDQVLFIKRFRTLIIRIAFGEKMKL